jgi:hypothetical protein
MIRIGVRSFVSAGGVPTDADAQAFITAAGITDATQQSAINTLVTDLKGYGVWSKMKAIYPFVGGTASAHKFNLKDPRDLDAAFRLVFTGGSTHSSTGWLPNGTNGYADTKFNPNSNLTSIVNSSCSVYSRTQSRGGVDIGLNISTIELTLSADLNLAGIYALANIGNQYAGNLTANSSQGYFLANRKSSTYIEIKRNNTLLATNTNSSSSTKPNGNVWLGAQNNSGGGTLFSNRQCAFASIGDGLTDTEAANFYTAVQAYQTTLSRNV